MILSAISEHISIDKLQKEGEKNYVHLLSRPAEFLGIPLNWDSVIYTTKSIVRAVIARHPGTIHLFRIIECNQPFDIKLLDGKSCRVTMFENSGLAENLAIYFKGDNCTALYTGCFTRCRALLLNRLLHQYVLKGIDVMFVDNTAVRSVDPVSVYSATVEILQITTKYPDYQIMMSVPPFGYEDLIFSLASNAKLKVFIEGAHLLTFEKYKMSKLFERDSQQAKVVVKAEEVTVETIFKRFVQENLITLRIILCELPPKNCYENIGLFEVHWSPHPSLFEIYTLINYVKPKSVKEIYSIPKLPSFLFVKKIEKHAINNSTNGDMQYDGDLSGKSTPVSEIEDLSEAESYSILKKTSGGNQRYAKKRVNVQTRFNSFVRNYNARLHDYSWKYYNLPKRIPRRVKKDHQKNTKPESHKAKEDDLSSDDLPSVSTFSSLTSLDECTGQNREIVPKLKTKQMSSKDAARAQGISNERRQNSVITQSRPNKVQKDAKPVNSTLKGKNVHQVKMVVALNSAKEDSSYDIPSVSTFSSLSSSVESNFNLNDQMNEMISTLKTTPASRTSSVQNRKVTDKSRMKNKSKEGEKDNQKIVRLNAIKDLQSSFESLSVSTFSSLSSSAESNFALGGQSNGATSQIKTKIISRKGIAMSKASLQKLYEKKAVKGGTKSLKNASKKGEKDLQIRTVRLNNSQEDYQSSCDFPSVSTFSSLLSTGDSNITTPNEIHDNVPQINTKEPSETGVIRMQMLYDISAQNADITQNTDETEQSVKKAANRIMETLQKSKRDMEEDAQVVPNVSDEVDSQSSEEFIRDLFLSNITYFSSLSNTSHQTEEQPDRGSAEEPDHLSFADFESVSTFTSLSSLSDKISTSEKSEKVSKKKKQFASKSNGQCKETKADKSSKPRLHAPGNNNRGK